MRWPNLFAALITLLIGSLSIDAMIDFCHMAGLIAGAVRWRQSDARRLAQKRLPRMIFNYVDGAASDEKAAQFNMDRLSDLRLMPRVLRNVSYVPSGP